MKREVLRLTLLDDVAISGRAASVGPHRGLEYITGSTLLGAAAQRLYEALPRDEAWLAFHSGKVRFGDGLPVASVPLDSPGAVGLPVPCCWYADKHRETNRSDFIDIGAIRNGQSEGRDDKPREQLRGIHVAPNGVVVKPARVLRMRTAIDPSTGLRRETALFGYQALSAGQDFVALLDADDDVSPGLFDRITKALTGGVLRIGRSRRAELGRVQCVGENDAVAAAFAPEPEDTNDAADHLTFWLLSDLALEDDSGTPLLAPSLLQLVGPARSAGMRDAPLDRAGSFIRPTRYSPYNGFLRCHDVERVVLGRGSVLHYKLERGEAAAFVKARAFDAGFGLYREAGLGRVWCNPALLESERPDLAAGERFAVRVVGRGETTPPADAYADTLLAWLRDRNQAGCRATRVEKTAKQWFKELGVLYKTAPDLAGQPGEPVGPQPSQWGRVIEAAETADLTPQKLIQALFEGDSAICKKGDDAWDARGMGADRVISFRDWLEAKTREWQSGQDPGSDLPLIVARLASDARRAPWFRARGGAER